MSADAVLDRYFLQVRATLLEIAATLDRIDRAEGAESLDDARRAAIDEALRLVRQPSPGRAEAVQRLFSRPYDADWFDEFERWRNKQ